MLCIDVWRRLVVATIPCVTKKQIGPVCPNHVLLRTSERRMSVKGRARSAVTGSAFLAQVLELC